MKRLLLLSFITFIFTSFYRSSVYVGDFHTGEPKKEVISQWEDIYLWGAVGTLDIEHQTQAFAKEHPIFMIETKNSFWNCVVGGVTFGIYTPTTTTYYIPNNK